MLSSTFYLQKLHKIRSVRQIGSQAAKLLQQLPINSEFLGPPKGFHPSTLAWIAEVTAHTTKAKETATKIQLDEHPHRVTPISLDGATHWKFTRASQYQTPYRDTFVAVLPGGRVWNDSAVITKDDRLLADLSIELGRGGREHSIFSKWKLRPAYYVDAVATVLTAPGGQNYCHWMFDVLPRIGLIQQSSLAIEAVDKFIVNGSHLPFQQETLAHLGISEAKIISSQKHSHVKAATLVVPSLLRGFGRGSIIGKFPCDFLRNNFLSYKSTTLATSERIYISRSDASYRRVLNEPELIPLLNRLGFQIVSLDGMTVSEQITLFSSAKIVMAPHGAGLTNIVFCNPGTKLIEIFSPNYVNACYWSICNYLDLKYYYLMGEGETPPDYVDQPVLYPYREDIVINPNVLLGMMKLADVI